MGIPLLAFFHVFRRVHNFLLCAQVLAWRVLHNLLSRMRSIVAGKLRPRSLRSSLLPAAMSSCRGSIAHVTRRRVTCHAPGAAQPSGRAAVPRPTFWPRGRPWALPGWSSALARLLAAQPLAFPPSLLKSKGRETLFQTDSDRTWTCSCLFWHSSLRRATSFSAAFLAAFLSGQRNHRDKMRSGSRARADSA